MTTIAWRKYEGKVVVCSDTQMTFNNSKWSVKKIYRLPDGSVLGLCGSVKRGLQLLEWWRGGCETDAPDMDDGDEDDDTSFVTGVLISPDLSCCILLDGINKQQVMDEFGAIGSGQDFARTAMSLGLGPKEAIEQTSKFDVYTNDKVETEEVTSEQ